LLAQYGREDPHLFAHLRIIKLDEWGGLEPNDPATCESYLRRHLLKPLNVSADRYLAFPTNPQDPQAECKRLEALTCDAGPIDLCVLGLGLNGHLGFNEPSASLSPGPHVAKLTESSLAHPMLRDARRDVKYGLTLGMADILRSRRILLLVNGEHKRDALTRLRNPNVTTAFPASFLWLHANVTCICDAAAAS
jgi:galactosamine-6-phosphate isomerase